MIKSSQKKLVICQVSLANNIPIIKENYKSFSKFYNKLIFFVICPKDQLKIFKKNLIEKNIKIISEDQILRISEFKKILNIYKKKMVYHNLIKKRLNWYYQQILKIDFITNNKICKNNNVVLWDADTLILKKIQFFKKNRSINYANVFEYHRPYFFTLEKLFNTKIPIKYLSSVNQFISLSPLENKFLKKKFKSSKNNSINAKIISNRIFNSIIRGNKDYNHSMFSEYEAIGICKQLMNKNFNQKIIFFLRYRINGKLSELQKKICIFLNCKHVTYEDHSENRFKKKILDKKQNLLIFFFIIIKQYLKFILRKFKSLIN